MGEPYGIGICSACGFIRMLVASEHSPVQHAWHMYCCDCYLMIDGVSLTMEQVYARDEIIIVWLEEPSNADLAVEDVWPEVPSVEDLVRDFVAQTVDNLPQMPRSAGLPMNRGRRKA